MLEVQDACILVHTAACACAWTCLKKRAVFVPLRVECLKGAVLVPLYSTHLRAPARGQQRRTCHGACGVLVPCRVLYWCHLDWSDKPRCRRLYACFSSGKCAGASLVSPSVSGVTQLQCMARFSSGSSLWQGLVQVRLRCGANTRPLQFSLVRGMPRCSSSAHAAALVAIHHRFSLVSDTL
jgi:hypothetical protein